tara:strand:- start:779 stop:1150 length:372 start_codon:yes stop_codon:yes gene_type:complete
MYKITRKNFFEAAHFLPNVPEGHKCKNMHGHSYRVTVQIDGVIDEHLGWIIDTAEIDAAFADVKAMLDHQVLNGIEGLENPTTEILSKWLWEFFKSRLNNGRIFKITVIVGESPRSTAIYDGL